MTKEKLDLGKAFEKLKTSEERFLFRKLIESERHLKTDEEYKYPFAFGLLSGAVKGHFLAHTDITYKEIDDLINQPLPTNETQGDA